MCEPGLDVEKHACLPITLVNKKNPLPPLPNHTLRCNLYREQVARPAFVLKSSSFNLKYSRSGQSVTSVRHVSPSGQSVTSVRQVSPSRRSFRSVLQVRSVRHVGPSGRPSGQVSPSRKSVRSVLQVRSVRQVSPSVSLPSGPCCCVQLRSAPFIRLCL